MNEQKHQYKLSDLPPVVRAAVIRYAEAKIAESWKGAGDPADWPYIEGERRDAADNMVRILKAHLKG